MSLMPHIVMEIVDSGSANGRTRRQRIFWDDLEATEYGAQMRLKELLKDLKLLGQTKNEP